MRKHLALALALILVVGLLAGCGGGNNNTSTPPTEEEPAAEQPAEKPAEEPAVEAKWADGTYYAEGEYAEKSGWKEIVGLKVEGGKIVSVSWNGLHKDGGLDKKTSSAEGKYGMVAKGGAQAEWHDQAMKMEQYLLDQQDLTALVINEEGKTDAVSGVSVGVDEFVKLVDEALAAGPVEPGPYKDGSYHAEEAEFNATSGWKYVAHITVLGGKIIAADWNGVHKDGGDDKDTQSKNGLYGLVEKGGAQSEWHEQALKAEQYLLETQDPAAITYTDEEGHTDAISGVSIHVIEFFDLAKKALEGAQ